MNESALPALDDTLSSPTVHLDEAGERLVLHLDPVLSVDEMETALRLLLDTRPDLRNRGLSLGFSDREVALFDLRRLTRLLAEDYGLTVAAVVVTERALLRYAQTELKVRLQVQSEDRSWSMDTARPMPMAAVHPFGSAGCEDPAPSGAQEQLVAGAGPACSVHAPAEAAAEAPACPPDDAPRLQDEDEVAEEPEPASGEAVPAAAAHAEPESGDGQASSDPAVRAVPVVVESDEAEELLSDSVAAGRVQALHRTLRSGATVRHNGDLIVFGDVNAGAQVVADGNIVVLGALRGVAHAGARGDESASVVALDLQPTQVRIASHIALAPERPEATGSRLRTLLQRERPPERTVCPEVAQLRDGAIVFGPFRGRLPSAGRS